MFTIDIYDKKTKKEDFFKRNGVATLEKCISCVSKETLNGSYELEVCYPLNDKKADYFKKWNVIKADGQLFRIYNTKNDLIDNKIYVYAKHIFYDLEDYFTIDKRAVECNVLNAMKKALETDNLGELYTLESNIEDINTLYFVEESPLTSIFSIVNRWGIGEIIRDNYNINIRRDVDYLSGYEIRYKKNMLGLTIEENVDDIATKIYPVGYNGISLPEKFITVPLNKDENLRPPHEKTQKVTFSEAQDVVNLRILAERYADNLAVPFTNIKCDMLEVYDTPEYARFTNIEKIKIGDVCKIVHENYSVDIHMKCVYIERDLINAKNNKVELGNLKDVLNKKPDFSDVYSKIEQAKPSLYFYQNDKDVTITEDFKELFYEAIGLSSNTHLKLYICINGECSQQGVVEIEIRINNQIYPLTPKQTVTEGYNTIGIPLAIPALQGGEAHYVSVKVKCTETQLRVSKNNAHIFAECVGGTGGTSTEKPHAEGDLTVEYTDVKLNEINSNCSITLYNPIKINNNSEKVVPEFFEENQNNLINSNVVTEVVKVLSEYTFDKNNAYKYEYDEDKVSFGDDNVSVVSTIKSEMFKNELEEMLIYDAEMPLRNKFKEIVREEVTYE